MFITILLADMRICFSQAQKTNYAVSGNTLGFAKKLRTEKDFGFSNFPDEAISLISKNPLEFVMVGWNNSYLMRGSSFKDASIIAKILVRAIKIRLITDMRAYLQCILMEISMNGSLSYHAKIIA